VGLGGMCAAALMKKDLVLPAAGQFSSCHLLVVVVKL